MINYVIYDTKTGIVSSFGSCNDDDISNQYLEEGQSIAEGTVDLDSQPDFAHNFNFYTKQWVQNEAALKLKINTERGALLSASDWTQVPDVPLPNKEAWAAYRQALRDIPQQEGYPYDIVWPVSPGAA